MEAPERSSDLFRLAQPAVSRANIRTEYPAFHFVLLDVWLNRRPDSETLTWICSGKKSERGLGNLCPGFIGRTS